MDFDDVAIVPGGEPDKRARSTLYSKEFIERMMAELNALADEYVRMRQAMAEARATVEIRYEVLQHIHKYAVMHGIEVPALPPPPVLYGPSIAKQRRLKKERRLAAIAQIGAQP